MRNIKNLKCLRLHTTRLWMPLFPLNLYSSNYNYLIYLIRTNTLFYSFMHYQTFKLHPQHFKNTTKPLTTLVFCNHNRLLLLYLLNLCVLTCMHYLPYF